MTRRDETRQDKTRLQDYHKEKATTKDKTRQDTTTYKQEQARDKTIPRQDKSKTKPQSDLLPKSLIPTRFLVHFLVFQDRDEGNDRGVGPQQPQRQAKNQHPIYIFLVLFSEERDQDQHTCLLMIFIANKLFVRRSLHSFTVP
jgi:hypothetical protein